MNEYLRELLSVHIDRLKRILDSDCYCSDMNPYLNEGPCLICQHGATVCDSSATDEDLEEACSEVESYYDQVYYVQNHDLEGEDAWDASVKR
jgi:hypothetical protein